MRGGGGCQTPTHPLQIRACYPIIVGNLRSIMRRSFSCHGFPTIPLHLPVSIYHSLHLPHLPLTILSSSMSAHCQIIRTRLSACSNTCKPHHLTICFLFMSMASAFTIALITQILRYFAQVVIIQTQSLLLQVQAWIPRQKL